jgi:hypothetical protein
VSKKRVARLEKGQHKLSLLKSTRDTVDGSRKLDQISPVKTQSPQLAYWYTVKRIEVVDFACK